MRDAIDNQLQPGNGANVGDFEQPANQRREDQGAAERPALSVVAAFQGVKVGVQRIGDATDDASDVGGPVGHESDARPDAPIARRARDNFNAGWRNLLGQVVCDGAQILLGGYRGPGACIFR